MRLALLKELTVQIGERKFATQLEYDLEVYKERLCNLAYEYYLGNKEKIIVKISQPKKTFFSQPAQYILDNEIMKQVLQNAFNYAFNALEKEIKKQSINIV